MRIGCDIHSVLTGSSLGTTTPVFEAPVFTDQYENNLEEITGTGNVTATVEINYDATKLSRPAVFVVALYNSDGGLEDVSIQETEDIKTLPESAKLQGTVEVTSTDQYIKAFVWDGLDTVMPIDSTYKKIGG